jgi:hypothetical protein
MKAKLVLTEIAEASNSELAGRFFIGLCQLVPRGAPSRQCQIVPASISAKADVQATIRCTALKKTDAATRPAAERIFPIAASRCC